MLETLRTEHPELAPYVYSTYDIVSTWCCSIPVCSLQRVILVFAGLRSYVSLSLFHQKNLCSSLCFSLYNIPFLLEDDLEESASIVGFRDYGPPLCRRRSTFVVCKIVASTWRLFFTPSHTLFCQARHTSKFKHDKLRTKNLLN